MSVRPKLKISVTAVPIGLYSLGNIPTGPLMVLSYFLGGMGHLDLPPKKKNSPSKKKYFLLFLFKSKILRKIRLIKTLGAKPL